MLAEAGADVTVEPWGEGRVVTVRASTLKPVERTVPADPSAAAFFVVAGCVVPGSEVVVADVYQGPARLGFVSVLERMGARVVADPRRTGYVHPQGRGADRCVPPRWRHRRSLPRRDPGPGGRRRSRRRDDGVQRGGGAAREGGRPPGGRGRAGRGLRCRSPYRRRHAGRHRDERPPAGWPLRQRRGPPDGHGGGGGGAGRPRRAQPDHGVRGGRDQLSGLRRRLGSPHGWQTGRRARSSSPSTDPPEPASRPCRRPSPGGSGWTGWTRVPCTGRWLPSRSARDIAPDDAEAVAALAAGATITVGPRVVIDGLDVTDVIRSPDVGRVVSVVAANPDVRTQLVARQRVWADAHGGGVVEGRDIGSVVFPGADVEGVPDRLGRGAGPPPARRGARANGAPRPDRLDPGRVTVAGGGGRPSARYDGPHRAGCRRGGVVVAVSTPDPDAGPTAEHDAVLPGERARPAPGVRGRTAQDPALPGRACHLRVSAVDLVPTQGSGEGARAHHRAGDPRPGAPFVRRLRFRGVLHETEAFLHDQGRDVEQQVAGPAAVVGGRLPGAPRVSRPRGARSVPRRSSRRGRCSCCSPKGPGGRARWWRISWRVRPSFRRGRGPRSCRSGSAGPTSPCRRGVPSPSPTPFRWSIGPAIPPPARTGGGRVSRSAVHAATVGLVPALQAVYDEARARTGRY